MTAAVSVWAEAPQRRAEGEVLAQRLGLPFGREAEVWLVLAADRLELRDAAEPAMGAVAADWLRGPMGYRRRHGGRGQALAKAVGLRGAVDPPAVVDGTAGLGRDAFVLANLGCRVTALERSPALFALLEDGLRRALEDPELGGQLEGRLQFVHADAREFLRDHAAELSDAVVYLDPMHPERRKSALTRKELRLVRKVAGADPDAQELFQAALAARPRRLVVKRPARAEPLGGPPSHSVTGKTTRYDVYRIPDGAGNAS